MKNQPDPKKTECTKYQDEGTKVYRYYFSS